MTQPFEHGAFPGLIEDGEFHPTCDVDADRVRDHRILCGKHAANGEAVADVGVGHVRSLDGDGEPARVLHLTDCALV